MTSREEKSVGQSGCGEQDAPEAFLARFGLDRFRPGQKEVISAVLSGEDCLCIMPTGGGKSLCYQLPAVAREGVTLVVSPLIALMKDQVDALQLRGISAEYINSSISAGEQAERLDRLTSGRYDLFYIAPERFRSPRFIEALRETKIQLLAIDEAHCISEWGHDFRHDYARLGEHRQRLGNPQTIALTATATVDVREDVVKQLRLVAPKTFVAGFARDNLHYVVEARYAKRDKELALLDYLARVSGTVIIYASTRKGCAEVHELIAARTTRRSAVYHAGLMPDERRKIQEAFMRGQAEIVVATNAFGMGIDKADVRMVLHYNMPGTLEAYYQEAGRAGRDGRQSQCVLLYSPRDRYIQEFFIDSAYPPRDVIGQVYDYLRRHPSDPVELTQQELKETLGLSISADGVGTCERLLEKCGVLERLEPNRNMAAIRVDSDAPALVELFPPQAEVRRRVARAIEAIVGSRRYEYVYLHPQEISDLSGLEPLSVQRALRELTRMDAFDYVPPFRGRAVHMLRRDLPFERLEIDYDAIEQRRQASLEKLDRVVEFATTRHCRQTEILRYFGEQGLESCGHCDNCHGVTPPASRAKTQQAPAATATSPADRAELSRLPTRAPSGVVAGPPAEHAPPPGLVAVRDPSAAILEAARMVLSGVARTKGRFGKQLVAAMLCGSKSAKVSRWKLDTLSTFGILDGFTQTEANALLQALIDQGLVEQNEVDRFRPTVAITDRGSRVMRGDDGLEKSLSLPPELLAKVDALYRDRQRDSGVVPDAEGLLSLRKPPPDKSSLAPDQRPTYYWTWRLLHDGYTAEECLAIRRLDLDRLVTDLLRAVAGEYPVQAAWVLRPEELAWLDDYMDPDSPEDREKLADSRPQRLGAELVEFYLRTRESNQEVGRT